MNKGPIYVYILDRAVHTARYNNDLCLSVSTFIYCFSWYLLDGSWYQAASKRTDLKLACLQMIFHKGQSVDSQLYKYPVVLPSIVITNTWRPFYLLGSTLIPVCTCITVEVWVWASNFIPHLLAMWLLTKPGINFVLISKRAPRSIFCCHSWNKFTTCIIT